MQLWTPSGTGSTILHTAVSRLHGLTSASAIQSALDDDATNGMAVVVAGGANVACSSGIDIDGGSSSGGIGGKLIGHGRSELLDFSSEFQKNVSRLVHSGTRNGTEHLIKYERAGFTFEDLCLSGRTRAQYDAGNVAKCPRGLFINRTGVSIGTGMGSFNRVSFDGFGTAVYVADSLSEHNCDTMSFYDCWWNDCDTAFQFNNEAALTYHWFNPYIGHSGLGTVGTFWDIYTGGRFTSYGGLMAGPTTFMKFRNDNADSWGQNAASYTVNDLQLDDGGGGNACIVDMETGEADHYYASINVNRLTCGAVAQNVPLFKNLSGRTHLRITNCSGLQKNCITWDTSEPGTFVRVTIENCDLSYTGDDLAVLAGLFDTGNSQGAISVRARNTGYMHDFPLEDLAETIEA